MLGKTEKTYRGALDDNEPTVLPNRPSSSYSPTSYMLRVHAQCRDDVGRKRRLFFERISSAAIMIPLVVIDMKRIGPWKCVPKKDKKSGGNTRVKEIWKGWVKGGG